VAKEKAAGKSTSANKKEAKATGSKKQASGPGLQAGMAGELLKSLLGVEVDA